jgi:hypothetical protein
MDDPRISWRDPLAWAAVVALLLWLMLRGGPGPVLAPLAPLLATLAPALLLLPDALRRADGLALPLLSGGWVMLLALLLALLDGATVPAALCGAAAVLLVYGSVGGLCMIAPRDARPALPGLAVLILSVLALAPAWLALWLDDLATTPWVIDAIVAVNPLTLLAAGSGADYLRSDWFYRYSPMGSLRYAYPPGAALLAAWLAIALLPLLASAARHAGAIRRHHNAPLEVSR